MTDWIDLLQWLDCVLVIGENPSRNVYRAELGLELRDDEWGYVINWWDRAEDEGPGYSRSIHELNWAGVNGMRGTHRDCDGDIVVVPLNRRGNS